MEPAKSLILIVFLLFSNLVFSQNINIKAYFNNDSERSYKDPYRGIVKPGSDFEAIMIHYIDKAQRSVDVAVQEINLTLLAKALARAHKRGVRVRVVLEDSYSQSLAYTSKKDIEDMDEYTYSKVMEHLRFLDSKPGARRYQDLNITKNEIEEKDAIVILRKAGVPLIDDSVNNNPGGLMHHKFIVIDGVFTVISSANFTRSGVHGDYDEPASIGNANALITVPDTGLAQHFTEEFEAMFVGKKFKKNKPFRKFASMKVGSIPVALKFSPTDLSQYGWNSSTNSLIASQVLKAKHKLIGNLFVFSSQLIGNALYKARKRSPRLQIELLVDHNFATQYYSSLMDMWGLKLRNAVTCRYQPDNFSWEKPVMTSGIPFSRKGDKLHHKFAVIDDEVVIFGSHNWSQSANIRNDETLIMFKSPVLARQFTKEHNRSYKNALLRPPQRTLDYIKELDRKCGF